MFHVCCFNQTQTNDVTPIVLWLHLLSWFKYVSIQNNDSKYVRICERERERERERPSKIISWGSNLRMKRRASKSFMLSFMIFRWHSHSIKMSKLFLLLLFCQLGRIFPHVQSFLWIVFSVCNSCQEKTAPGAEKQQRITSNKVGNNK